MPRKATQKLNELLNNSTPTAQPNITEKSIFSNKEGLSNLKPEGYKSTLKIDGLFDLEPSKLGSELPQHDFNTHKVTDPLNPPTTFMQTDGDRARTEAIYQQRANAYASLKDSYTDAGNRFDAIGAKATAIGKGIKAADKADKARGNFLDYLKTQEDNKQKYVGLQVTGYTTANAVQKAVYTQQELDMGLQQAQTKAAKATLDSQKSLTELEEFRKQLGESKSK
ncbi:MAG: hypothetical protein HC836_31110 [Richelia sp. RM2_1_2]|nr:hypothetical protein [Richelia sp. RM2_1_2]